MAGHHNVIVGKTSSGPGFSILAEIEPATRPDLAGVRRQIAVLAPVVDEFLIPDNHLGRSTVSSLAVAHEVAAMGGRSIACLNARDRNRLGLRRDLLTAAAYGVTDLLLVRGDLAPGSPKPELGVRDMIAEVRECATSEVFRGLPPFRVGVTARPGTPLPAWKREADFLVTQVSFAAEEVVAWRGEISYDGPVLAGVLVLASAGMAERLLSGPYDISIPESMLERVTKDRAAGTETALQMVEAFASAEGVDGVHLIPGQRYREVAMGLLLQRSDRWGASAST